MTGDWTSAKNSTNQTIISVQSNFFFCRSFFLETFGARMISFVFFTVPDT